MPPTSIFIKTCKRDLEWLDYCIRSLPFFTSEREVILIADSDCYPQVNKYTHLVDKLICLPVPCDGYLWQQVLKLQAHRFCQHELILFLDSDSIINRYCDISSLLVNGKLCIGYRELGAYHISQMHNKFLLQYNRIVKKELNIDTNYEHNMLVPGNICRSTIVELENRYPSIIPVATNNAFTPTDLLVSPSTLLDWLKSDKAINEFNMMYSFAYANERDKYHWWNYDECCARDNVITFNWSWDNLDSKREKLESILSNLRQ